MLKKLRTEAKQTHNKYGKSNQEANLDIFQLTFIINIIDSASKIISNKASKGLCIPKYKTLQRTLRAKLIPKAHEIFFLIAIFLAFIQEKYNDKAIRKNKIFQTIGNTQFGGVIAGLTELYQSPFVSAVVNMLPIPATR